MGCAAKEIIVLLCICIFFVCDFALIYIPGPFEHDIIKVFNIDVYRYSIIVSLCSWASLLDIVHGYLLDRYLSLPLATWIYVSLVVVGSILYCISAFTKKYWMIVVGRCIFGLGGNPLALLCNKHIILWFGKGHYVTLIYSLTESILWLGSTVVFYITTHIMSAFKQVYTEDVSYGLTSCIEIGTFSLLLVLAMLTASFLYKYVDQGDQHHSDAVKGEEKKRTFKDHVCLPFIFWMFAFSVFLFYVTIMSFVSMSLLFLTWKYHVSQSYASTLSGTITLLAALLSPITGAIMDRVGHNLSFFTAGILLCCLSQAVVAFTEINALVPVLMMSFSLGMASGVWSQFQFLVEEHQHMVAYGVAQTGVNGAQAIGTMIAGSIISSYGNQGFIVFQFVFILCSLPFIGLVWYLDWKRGFFINMVPVEKSKALARMRNKTNDAKKEWNGENNNGFTNDEILAE